jgi:membrane protease YdiL (CAAX protease family)
MAKGIYRESTPLTRLLLTGTIVFTSLLIFYLIGIAAVKLFYNTNLSDLATADTESIINTHVSAFKLFQVLQSIGFFILPPFIVGYLVDKDPLGYLQLNKKSVSLGYLIVPFIMIASIPFINYLVAFNESIHLPASLKSMESWMKEGEKSAEALTKVFLKAENWKDLASNLLLIALLPAIGEELLFRGLLQKQFAELSKNHHVGIWLAAFLFSFMHFQFFGFIPRLILGVLLGYIYYFSKSLWLPILAHFTNNALAVVFYYLSSTGQVGNKAEEIGSQPDEIHVAFMSLAIAGILLFVLYRIELQFRKTNSLP